MVVFAVLLLAAVAVAGRAGRFEGALVFLWGFASMRSARHIPLFAIVAAPVIAEAWAGAWREMAERWGPGSVAAILRNFATDLGRHPRPSAWLAVSAVVVLMVLPPAGFSEARFPVMAVEQNAVRLAPAGIAPRVLTSDQWADYLIYRLYPRQRVFFDGRSDFFGPRIGGDYRTLFGAEPGWVELLDRYGFDLALLPHDWPLSTMLERQPGWRVVYRDKVAVLYARKGIA
jgi:hypothetical protein